MGKNRRRSIISRLGLFDRYSLSFILSSLIPIAVLVFVMYRYAIPYIEDVEKSPNLAYSLVLLMYCIVFLAILAFFVSRSVTREMVDSLQSNNGKLKNVFEISESLSRECHLDVLLDVVLRKAIELTNASAGIVLIRDKETGDLVFEVTRGLGRLEIDRIPANSGVAGWVTRHQKLALIDDVLADPRYMPELNILPDFDTSSILAAPLGSGSESFGTIELLKDGHSTFTGDDANLLKSLASQTSIFIQNVKFREDQQNYFTHITDLLLSALDGTRQFWPGHMENTARYTYLIAKQLGLPDGQLKKLHYAALFHDIGFIKINLKDGPPRKLIEHHPEFGYEMLEPIAVWRDIAPVVRYHHERFDGEGYPHGLKGRDIPLGSRIIAIAEALETMTNPKSYKKETLEMDRAIQEISAYSGTQFDPKVVEALTELLEAGYL